MADDEKSSFLTSVPGLLTALGTLIAGGAAVVALLVHSSGGKPSPSPTVTLLGGPSTLSITSGSSSPAGGSTVASSTGSGTGTGDNGEGGNGPGGGNGGGSSTPTVNPPALAITGVTFAGTTQTPTVIINGQGFGTSPAGQPNNPTSCGAYTNNGDAFGASDLWFQDSTNFLAGQGTPPSAASCIGIIIQSWTSDQIIYQFGNAYDSFDHWYITAGDQFTVSVKGVQYTGTVSLP